MQESEREYAAWEKAQREKKAVPAEGEGTAESSTEEEGGGDE